MDGLEDHRRGAQRQAGAAVLLRDQRRQVLVLGERVDERVRVLLGGVELLPVLAGEALADAADRLAQHGPVVAELEVEALIGALPAP